MTSNYSLFRSLTLALSISLFCFGFLRLKNLASFGTAKAEMSIVKGGESMRSTPGLRSVRPMALKNEVRKVIIPALPTEMSGIDQRTDAV